MTFERLRFWVGLLLAIDAMILLTTHRFWQRRLPDVRILPLAKLEAAVALIILALHLLGV